MPNRVDFLEALDAHVRRSQSGEVADDWNLRLVAQDAGLAELAEAACKVALERSGRPYRRGRLHHRRSSSRHGRPWISTAGPEPRSGAAGAR